MHKIACPNRIGLQRFEPGTFFRGENDFRVFRLLFQPVPDVRDLGEIAQIDAYDRKWPGRPRLPYSIDGKDERIEDPFQLLTNRLSVCG